MRKRNFHRRIRKWHRYLGVLFGIQFFLWTLGGLYFSWTNIKAVRGDDIKKEIPQLAITDSLASVNTILSIFKTQYADAEIMGLQLTNDVTGKPVYQVKFKQKGAEHFLTADAITGQVLPLITEQQAGEIAVKSISKNAAIKVIHLISETNRHHEYRGKPLPAYAVVLSGDVNCTVYVGQETGMVQSIRNKQWRIFDFLWMLHTMDYSGRDNINNWTLRIFSVLGLITIISGFMLYYVSIKKSKMKYEY